MSKKTSERIVFLSSTARDLAEYRSAVYQAIDKLEGYRCVRMENFTSQPSPPETYIQELVPSCDLFVGLIGLCYGSRPLNSNKSYTELEYDKAQETNIPCLMFLTPDDFSVQGNILHNDHGWDEQQQFRERISKVVVRSTFKTPDELALQVIAAIRNWEQRITISPFSLEKKDCIILSGGYSKRLWPLTIDLSKHLLPVGGRPILSHALDFVRESSLVKSIFLLTNPKFSLQTQDFLEKYRASQTCANVEILVEPASTPEEKLGPIGALNYAITLSEPRDLLIIAGDNLFGFKLDEFIKFSLLSGQSSNALYRFQSQENVSEYGVVSLNDEYTISDFQEKQAISTYRNISTACYFLRKIDVELIPKYLRLGGNPDSLGSFIHWLILQGSNLVGFIFSSFWFDIGTRQKLLQANWKFLIDSRRGQIDENTSVKGPAQIESSSIIRDSKVGPYVYIGPNAQIVDSHVQNSLIMNSSIIRHSSIMNSIVGPGSRIEGSLDGAVCGPGAYMITDLRREPS